jgi:hypothetical protein
MKNMTMNCSSKVVESYCHGRIVWRVAVLSSLLCLLFSSPVTACGGFFCQSNNPVLQSGEAILFAVDGDTVTMHVQIQYEGPADGFSWILPIPSTPTLSMGTDVLFRSLFDATLPTFELLIDNAASTTCNLDQAQPFPCPLFFQDASSTTEEQDVDDEAATVVKEGSVGPFDFVVLEAADNNPSSILEWLIENGYDQPPGADALLNYYALMSMQFVALRLKSNSEVGEIEPIILQYEMPPALLDQTLTTTTTTTTQVARRALACVPIQLTRIAATEDMPVQVYVLGDARAVPLNYLEVKLDDSQVDWVGCLNNDTCYDSDYRQRFIQATGPLLETDHVFITEYAGPTEILDNQIAINLTAADLQNASNPIEFLQILANNNVPDTRRLTAIIDEFIPPVFDDENAPSFCRQFTTAYQGPGNGFGIASAACLSDSYAPTQDWVWDPVGLAQALEEDIFSPSRDVQDMVLQYKYLTRLYTRLSPDQMNKDPFFSFKSELPTVSHIHEAMAVPECLADGTPIALEITVPTEDSINTLTVSATIGCNGWFPTEPQPLDPNTTTAAYVAAWGFTGDDGVVVNRSPDGVFNSSEVQMAIDFGDSLVMNQTVPDYDDSAVNRGTGGEKLPLQERGRPTNVASTQAVGEVSLTNTPSSEGNTAPDIESSATIVSSWVVGTAYSVCLTAVIM